MPLNKLHIVSGHYCKGTEARDRIEIYGQKLIILGISKNPHWFLDFQMLLWWDVVIAISHASKVKTYWRNNSCWRDFYYISLRSSLLLGHWLCSWFLFVYPLSINIFLGGGETVREPRRMSKNIPRPSNRFSLFIEIYSSIVVAILEYYRRVLNVILKKSPIGLFLKHVLT